MQKISLIYMVLISAIAPSLFGMSTYQPKSWSATVKHILKGSPKQRQEAKKRAHVKRARTKIKRLEACMQRLDRKDKKEKKKLIKKRDTWAKKIIQLTS